MDKEIEQIKSKKKLINNGKIIFEKEDYKFVPSSYKTIVDEKNKTFDLNEILHELQNKINIDNLRQFK